MVNSSFPRERVGKALHKAGLSEMPYGYLIRNPGCRADGGRGYEIAMAVVGISVTSFVVAMLALPTLRGGPGIEMAQVASSVTLLSLAVLLLRNANLGKLVDTEIDFNKEEVRMVRRNARGGARVEKRVPFDQISSLFVHRSKMKASCANALCLRVVGSDAENLLVQGTEEAMSTLHRRLVRDINTVVVARKATRFAQRQNARGVADAAEAARAGLSAA